MELIVLGINHKTAPIEIRECLAFKSEDLETALAGAHALPSVKENMILSTCNRVEIFAVSREDKAGIGEIKDFLSRFHHLPLEKFGDCIYLLTGNEAVRHVFRVASSLDSLVVGEPQILGQIKSAYETAVRCQTSGVILHRLLHGAFHVAKRVRTETGIGNSAVSVSSVAVDLARKIFETLEERTVLLIGAGEMCELAAQHLVSGGVGRVLVANRTFERACSLAQKFQGEAIPFEQFQEGLKKADIVISATDSRQVLLEKDSDGQDHERAKVQTHFLHRYRRSAEYRPPGERYRECVPVQHRSPAEGRPRSHPGPGERSPAGRGHCRGGSHKIRELVPVSCFDPHDRCFEE